MSNTRTSPLAVLDTNLVVSAQMTTTGSPAQVLDGWRHQAFALATSLDIIAELTDVLTRSDLERYFRIDRTARLRLIAEFADSVVVPLPLTVLPLHCRDPKDDKVLACAFGAGADYIVTGDRDLLDLNGDAALGRLHIVTPEAFLSIL